jgi:2-desacetyl-2-hydroxyethyl bacteriochlorophyllide A dehydrogenase
MLVAQFIKPGNLSIVDYPIRKLNDDELLIEISACGVCGTDFHIYKGDAPASFPIIPGHEYSGVIADKGASATEFNIEDHVAIDPNIYCGYCNECRNGRVNFCENHKALGVTLNGGFAEYSIAPSKQAYLLPKDFPLSDAAFAEPLSCCIRGIDRAEIKCGDNVVIVGGGTIGLLMLQLAKLRGAAVVALIEPITSKQNVALNLGANFVLAPDDSVSINNLIELTHGGFDVVLECVGSKDAVEQSNRLIRRGGTLVIFGLADKSSYINLNLFDIFRKEISIKTSFLNPFTFQRAINLLASGRINVRAIQPKQYTIQDIKKVFNSNSSSDVIKYQIINKKKEAR